MKNKTWIIVISIVLVVVLAVVVTVNICKNNNSNGMNVKRDESVDIGPIVDRFNNNVENVKDVINKTE